MANPFSYEGKRVVLTARAWVRRSSGCSTSSAPITSP
jgi:hypothetical protein